MLSNFTLGAVVDAISHLREAHKASRTQDKVFYLGLAENAVGRVLRGMPAGHPRRAALEAKEREIIFARARLLS